MDTTLQVNLEDYIALYNQSLPLSKIKPLNNPTFRIFKGSNLDIRLARRKQVYENPLAFEKIKKFTLVNDWFYMIPVTTMEETIVGFIIRGVFRSDYNTISREFTDLKYRVPLMFGFDKRFKNFAELRTCYPIVVCEGSKDCIFMKQFYPYTVSINTSSMGLNAYILINISNKFVLAYDNDKAGQEGIERDKKVLRNLGAQVVSLELDNNLKDCAQYLNYPEKIPKLKEELYYKLKRVMSF